MVYVKVVYENVPSKNSYQGIRMLRIFLITVCFCVQIRVARLEQLEKELHEAQSSRGPQEKSALPETQVTHTPLSSI